MLPPSLEIAVYGLIVTPMLQLADKHGMLAELLAHGPLPSTDVAARIDADPDTVDRILLVLASAGLLHRDSAGAFAVDPAVAPYLDAAHPGYIGGFVKHMVDALEQLPRLERYLALGKRTVDADLPAPYDHFYQDDLSTAEFMSAMWSLSYDVSRELAELAALDGSKVLVDVGGASGPFSVAALEQNPRLRAIVFDLPNIRPHLESTRDKYGLTDRLEFAGGDFFADELPEGDVVAFGYVMSNWPDAECKQLLHKAFRACQPGGRVLVMERLFDDDRNGPLSTAVMNLTMQVETRGVHRTAAELVALLEDAGFTGCAVHRSGRDKHLVVGHRPAA
ncbi:methyltransferase [Nocardia miyunensis]|uniref:methyltransferase n=1 Tax=Nocardia miyunensis TaxID=282684 RepID=UPI000832F0D9|nr:methyltransferase [Nocardia miyunensis]